MSDKQKKATIHRIEITEPDGSKANYMVRHNSHREARAWLLDEKVTSRRATEDEIMDLARSGGSPIGPFEPINAEVVDEAQSRFDLPAPDRED